MQKYSFQHFKHFWAPCQNFHYERSDSQTTDSLHKYRSGIIKKQERCDRFTCSEGPQLML
jgi:hypothetical protein